jgi:uncharacterized lipoprotein NlpE involved in copper resistance
MAGLTKEQREAKKAAALEAAGLEPNPTTETINSDPSFAEVPGSPAIEHQKKLARAKKVAAKVAKPSKQFYTIKDGKVLSIKVKQNGAYSTYVGTKAKMEKKAKGSYFSQVKVWQKAGLWVSEEDFQEHCEKIKDELAKE